MYDFLTDLDEFFCEKYANYDKLCVLPGYKMPVMQATKIDEFGRTYAYTLPANTMRLATQEKKSELLAELKKRIVDKTFSFSFQPVGLFARIKNVASSFGFTKNLKLILAKYKLTEEEILANIDISQEIWRGIWRGKFLPSKNLLFSMGLCLNIALEDIEALMKLVYDSFDFAVEKDVVAYYLLSRKVYNREMIDKALAEYKIENLFMK